MWAGFKNSVLLKTLLRESQVICTKTEAQAAGKKGSMAASAQPESGKEEVGKKLLEDLFEGNEVESLEAHSDKEDNCEDHVHCPMGNGQSNEPVVAKEERGQGKEKAKSE